MSIGWSGPDPTMENEPGVDYELATRYSAVVDIAITGIRVWAGSSSESVVGRTGRIWTTGGTELASAALDASLAPGWTIYPLAEPVVIAAGGTFDVSYSTLRFYGAVSGGYPRPSTDAAVTATQGRFHDTPGAFPNTISPGASFYGIDVEYELAGNLAPEVTALSVVADGLDVDATATIEDESPASVTIRWLWGDGNESSTGAGVLTAAHTYAAPGLYAVTAVATDNAAQKGFRSTPVIVRNDAGLWDLDASVLELVARLQTIPGLHVHAYGPEAKRLNAPAAIVTLPSEPVSYHETYQHGGPAASAVIPIVVAVGKVHSRSAYKALAAYVAAGGARSIRATIESGVFTQFDGVTVRDADFSEWTFAGDTYLVAVFSTVIMK